MEGGWLVVRVEVEGRGQSCYGEVGQVWQMEAGAAGRLVEALEVELAGGPRWRTGWRTGEGRQ